MIASSTAARAALLAVGLVGAGLLAGRADLVVLALPFVLALLYPAVRRAPSITVSAALAGRTVREGEPFTVDVSLLADSDVPLAVVDVGAAGFRRVGGTPVTALAAGVSHTVTARVVAGHWGRTSVGPVRVVPWAPFATYEHAAASGGDPVEVSVLPAGHLFHAASVVPKSFASSGVHRSWTAGPGVEFAGIRPYLPGDRPRRINWRATLRSTDLQINTALTDEAARIWILLDSQHTGRGGGRAMLDTAVRAATGVAEHYLGLGDTVGMIEYGGRNRILPAGGGRRQLALVREWLLDTGPVSAATPAAEPWLVRLRTTGALAIALTPLLDETAAANLLVLRRHGAHVVAVDTLADRALPVATDRVTRLALRIWLLERQALAARLTDLGVPVVRWGGGGSLDLVLRDLVRMANAPSGRLP